MGEYAPSSEINYEYFRNIFWVGEIMKRKDLKYHLNPLIVGA